MERKEPTTGLVHTFCNEVRGIVSAVVNDFLVFERIVQLSVRHGTRIEPNINQVKLALHWFSACRHKGNVIHIRTVKVYLIVVFLVINSRFKSHLLVRIGGHEACGNRLFYLVVKFFNRADTDFLALFTAPDWKRGSPVT